MTMKTFIYILLALYHMAYSNACTWNFLEEKCAYEAHCKNYIDYEDKINPSNICNNHYMQCNNGYNNFPMTLFFKNTADDLHDYLNSDLILCTTLILNLSFNNYQLVPNLHELRSLETLNVSHNALDTASLYNNYELISLREVDFSYNKIKEIHVDENQFIYRGLKKLWLAHNQLEGISENIFSDFSDLEYLDLSFNRIANVTQSTFEGLKKLLVLQLSNNEINNINLSLFRFNKLKELYLSNNKIRNVLVRDFEKLNDLEILDLSHNIIVALEKNVFESLRHLKIVDLSANLLTTIDKNIFSSTIYLQSVDLTRNEITELPIQIFLNKSISQFSIKENNIQGSLKRGTFEGLKFITKMDLSNQGIIAIEDYAFFGLENLLELLLNNNLIQVLSNKSFKTLIKLVRLDLSFNKITQIDFDKEYLLSLQSIIFHGNQITKLQKHHLHDLNRLQFVDLSYNNISEIEAQTFKNLVNVNNLLISKNPLRGNLEANIFEGLNSVPLLDLSCTKLNAVQNYSFNSMFQLYNLNISYSNINEVQYNSFSHTGNIQILDLSHNEIEIFSINTTHLSNLEQLMLNNNHIKILNDNFLKGISLLNKIVLSHNYIGFIDNKHFEDQKFLRYIDLSFNSNIRINFSFIGEAKELETLILSGSPRNISFKNIGEIPITKLEYSHSNIKNLSDLNLSAITKLQNLKVNNNNLTRLEVGAFSNLTNVNEIDASYNNINMIQPGTFKDNYMLETLNISHNALYVLSYGALRGLLSLNVLDISYNFIDSLKTEIFSEVVTLTELIADHNRITDVSIEDFHGTDLKMLSIGDNPLNCNKIVELRSSRRILITAIRMVDIIEENSHGITCNLNNNQKYLITPGKDVQKQTSDLSDSILTEMREILLTLKSEKNSGHVEDANSYNMFNLTHYLKNNHDDLNSLKNLNNISLQLNEEQKNTNRLLERILKVFLATSELNTSRKLNESVGSVIDTNVTSGNFSNIIHKVKQDFVNAMLLDREKILAEIEDKMLSISKRIEPLFTTTAKPASLQNNEKLLVSAEPKPSIFVETCVALILFIAICLVLFKIYESRKYILRRRSVTISTRHIANAMDTSNV